ncbi:MAG: integrase arm-type DNA-binding domain-containing protein [Rhodospirillaceae bacterium]
MTAAGAKTWVFRFSLAGRRRDMGLGSAKTFSLAEARQRALAARKQVADGIDPIDAKVAAKAPPTVPVSVSTPIVTFIDCAESYIETHRAQWGNPKHCAQWTATMRAYVFPVIGLLSPDAIDTAMVLRILEPIWPIKTETASRVRGRIEAILDYARIKGYRTGDNPARWKGHLSFALPSAVKIAPVEHHASLPYNEMGEFWPKLQLHDGLSARALEFAILTACRSGEVFGARWSEIDIEIQTWTIPAGRIKAGKEHRVPLTATSMSLLRKLASLKEGADRFVFPGQKRKFPLSNMAMKMALRRMNVDVTAHGFRATFRTWAAECTGHPHDVIEMALAHTPGDKVVAAYQRGDLFEKRRRLMEDWATFCTS